MSMQKITIDLPESLYNHLIRASELARLPVADIVRNSLAHSLSPLLEDIPPEYQVDVYPLLQMDRNELLAEIRRVFPPERWARYESLLIRKKEAALTSDEEEELSDLKREADVLMFRKGYAAVLLKRQGYRPPSPDELPIVQ